MRLQQTSLAVLLWAAFAGAVLTLVSTPAMCLTTTVGSLLSSFSSQLVDPLRADETEAPAFFPSDNVMADVDATLARAKAGNKLALVVLGANWCHDSQGLAAHLDTPEMQDIIARKYELVKIDVGLFEHGVDVVRRFGQPVIYGTPTVFVIDPENGHVLNRKSMHQWRAAASISLKDTVDYFENQSVDADQDELASTNKENLKAALGKIDDFEAAQAARIEAAYKILGPLVGLPKDERPENFYDMWEQVRVLRYKLPEDLMRLRAIARRKAAYTDAEFSVDLPEYAPFSWE
jgi:hypothetical protein